MKIVIDLDIPEEYMDGIAEIQRERAVGSILIDSPLPCSYTHDQVVLVVPKGIEDPDALGDLIDELKAIEDYWNSRSVGRDLQGQQDIDNWEANNEY